MVSPPLCTSKLQPQSTVNTTVLQQGRETIRFKVRSALIAISAAAFAAASLANPTRNMQLLVSIAASIVLLAALALAIGSDRKLRIQYASFCVLATVLYFGHSSDRLPFAFAIVLSRTVLEKTTENTTLRSAPDGTLVYQREDGSHMIRRNGTGQYEPISTDELEKSGLIRYAVSDNTSVSSDALEGIYEHLLAMAAGVFGYVLAGIAYERRDKREAITC